MKLNYKLKVFLLAFVFGVFTNVTIANSPMQTETIANNSNEWVEIQNENGVKVYFLEYNLSGNSYLKIKFENLTNKPVNFNWSLKNKNSENVVSDNVNELKSNGSTETIHSAHSVLIKNGESSADFSININIK